MTRSGAGRLLRESRVAAAVVASLSLATAAIAAEPPPFEDTIAQRMRACVGCHGEHGGGVADAAFPRLAGQPVDYLVAQMQAFRAGARTYAPMNFLMSRQSDAYFVEIAKYFSAQPADRRVIEARRKSAAGSADFAAVLAAGRALVVDGRAADAIPACTACHGATLAGTLPGIPALAGMPRDFLVEQVGSWKNGTHRGAQPDCMARIAKRMTGADIVAAATWLSLQQPDGAPTPRTGPLPLACGER